MIFFFSCCSFVLFFCIASLCYYLELFLCIVPLRCSSMLFCRVVNGGVNLSCYLCCCWSIALLVLLLINCVISANVGLSHCWCWFITLLVCCVVVVLFAKCCSKKEKWWWRARCILFLLLFAYKLHHNKKKNTMRWALSSSSSSSSSSLVNCTKTTMC